MGQEAIRGLSGSGDTYYLLGLNLFEQVLTPPCLQTVPMPQRSLTTTESAIGLELKSHCRNSLEPQYVSGASQSPSTQSKLGKYFLTCKNLFLFFSGEQVITTPPHQFLELRDGFGSWKVPQ